MIPIILKADILCFNPCFNGFMDKWLTSGSPRYCDLAVSTLVLMDSWINGVAALLDDLPGKMFQPLF